MNIHKLQLTPLPFGSRQGQLCVYVQISAGPQMVVPDLIGLITTNHPGKKYPIFLDVARSAADADIADLVGGLSSAGYQLIVRGWWTMARHWMTNNVAVVQKVNIKDWVGIPFGEIHVVYNDPELLADPVMPMPNMQLFIEPGSPATFQDLIKFLANSPNQWRILMPPKFDLVKDLLPKETPNE